MNFVIATAQSRLSKRWKNTETTWPEIVERLRQTTRTSETLAEYKNMTKADKDARKDVGGFVGGSLREGRRKAENVIDRSLICLDIDYADVDFVDLVKSKILCEWVIYSTHSHTEDSPRFRIVLPLDKPITPDQYGAVSRMIAKQIGIDMFDDTTYEPHRLMYWPSTPQDGVYIFERNEGPYIVAEDVLGLYKDWRDTSFWPVSSRANRARDREIKKQGDPLEKQGLIGAFCRAYPIQEAISEFLSGIYEGESARYTFKGGSTVGGVVVYDDKFIYSHHGTDPCSGQLCNAWDMVRLHKFGIKDDDVPENAPSNKRPSHIAMQGFASQDQRVKRLMIEERMVDVNAEFGVVGEVEDQIQEIDNTWIDELETTKKGELAKTIDNFKIILANDPNLKGLVGIDEFNAGRLCLLRDCLWGSKRGSEWSDNDDAILRLYIEKNYGLYAPKKLEDAFNSVTLENSFHPVRSYLDKLAWDGIERVDRLFIDYLGAEDSEYVKAVTRKSLCAAIARIYKPGVKFDNVVILSGEQGIGKSYLLSKLGGCWFNDSINSLQGKEAYELIQGSWIIELGELKAFRGAASEVIKHFLSKTHDTFRGAYERRTKTHPRQCVFFGTTNHEAFLSDATGDRRSWPIELDKARIVKSIFDNLTDDDIDLIWAEAKYLWEKGEQLFLDREMTEEAQKVQEKHYDEPEIAGLILDFAERQVPVNWDDYSLVERRSYWFNLDNGEITEQELVERTQICALEVWCELLHGDPKNLDRRKSKEINDVFRRSRVWRNKYIRTKPYGGQKGFLNTLVVE